MRLVDIAPLRAVVALRDDDEGREAASTDFGRLVRRMPRAVVTPRSPEDVRRTLDFACRAHCPVAVRGAGHSQAGQSLTDGGLLLDMTGLDRIGEIRDGAIRVQAGATWRSLVRHVQARGHLPPVLTTNLDVTVGGTLSTGGLGASSHRYGAQTDNVDELVVVTGDARQLRCSRTENPALFDCVRCGLGQFAVITEARIRLRRALPDVRTFFLAYDDVEALMQDQRQAVSDDRFEYVASACLPRAVGLERLLARGSPFAARRYVMSLTAELDRELDPGGALAGLRGGRLLGVEDGSGRDVPFGLDRSGSGNREDRSLAHPWIEGIVPWRDAGRCVAEVLADLPSALPADTAVLLWSARRDRFGAPMLALPAGELLMGFAVLPAVKPAALPRLLPGLEAAGRRLTTMGGKRYLSGWIDYDHEQWRAHFGDLWPRVLEWKASFDPRGILNPGFIRYRPARPA
ncbi:MAG: FAD-binding protein [Acidobacteria bacterium]|nr:FAD-binding protein [Acidobacteriota bacterium]